MVRWSTQVWCVAVLAVVWAGAALGQGEVLVVIMDRLRRLTGEVAASAGRRLANTGQPGSHGLS